MVDASIREIHIEYKGNPESLERVTEIVRMIGYAVEILWDSIS